MIYFKINNTDFSHLVSSLKVGYETLVSDNSGRNAAGNTVIDIINRKIKVYVGFRPMLDNHMNDLLTAIKDYVVNISYLDPETKALKTIQCYTGTPEPEYFTIQNNRKVFKQMSLNFIEL